MKHRAHHTDAVRVMGELVQGLTCRVDTTPLAMTDSFPATERTPLLNCVMSGTAGRTLLKL